MTGNGRSGRKRKSAAIRRAEGNRGHRPIPNEPTGRDLPRMPDHFNATQRLVWKRVLATAPEGVLAGCDEFLLEAFCTSVATMREARAMIDRSSLMVRGDGGPVNNPMLRVESRAKLEMRTLAAELGLSPSSRAKLIANVSAEIDPMEMLLGNGDPDNAWDVSSGPH